MATPHFTLEEYRLLLEAFTNWIGDAPQDWDDFGKARTPEYQKVIGKLEAKITQLGG